MSAPDICKIVRRDKKHLVQLCLPYERLKTPLKFPVLASEKLDGVFAFAYVEGNSCYIYSRTGEEYVSLEHLKPEFLELARVSQCNIFIFEAYTKGVPQPTISGWCRDTKNQHNEVHAYVHDIMTIEAFENLELCDTYYERSTYLYSVYKELTSPQYLHLVHQRHITDEATLMKMAETIWDNGGEGVVARPEFAGYYPGKRNQYMIKIKQGVSFDLKVVALEEGTGKYKGSTGKLICQDRKGKKVKVGSGLTDEQRRNWWSPFGYDEIVGKIVQVDAMAISKNGVLREPRFKGIRTDKVEVDVIE